MMLFREIDKGRANVSPLVFLRLPDDALTLITTSEGETRKNEGESSGGGEERLAENSFSCSSTKGNPPAAMRHRLDSTVSPLLHAIAQRSAAEERMQRRCRCEGTTFFVRFRGFFLAVC